MKTCKLKWLLGEKINQLVLSYNYAYFQNQSIINISYALIINIKILKKIWRMDKRLITCINC